MSEDKSFDSFYSKLNKVVIGKFNLGGKMEDSKVVRKILHAFEGKISVQRPGWRACWESIHG